MTVTASDRAFASALKSIGQEGIASRRERLLLWLIRNQHGVGAADSYEYVFSEELLPGLTVDGAVVTESRDITAVTYYLLDETASALAKRVREATTRFSKVGEVELSIVKQNSRFRSLFDAAIDSSSLELVRTVVCVCDHLLTPAERNSIKRASRDPRSSVEVFDLAFLRALAAAEVQEGAGVPQVTVRVSSDTILPLRVGTARGIVMPVAATDIAEWPGIEDRSLFDLNVRHALGVNRVRKSLDVALTDRAGAEEFIAYHNGITAVCSRFEVLADTVSIRDLSVVNGAQTVVAIHANEGNLAPGVRVLLKLIEAPADSQLSRNIAIRSNTQNPVTSRNLRALDITQERLVRELRDLGYLYAVRPDQGSPQNSRVIRNDDVAQLLCSIYERKPALAVKRQVLFEFPLYQEIFPPNLDPARVVFAHLLRQVVESEKTNVPTLYRGAWALTALTLVYMSGEAMRADPRMSEELEAPAEAIGEPDQLRAAMVPFVSAASRTLKKRRTSFEKSDNTTPDDFKVAFKQTRTLQELGVEAARLWRSQGRGTSG